MTGHTPDIARIPFTPRSAFHPGRAAVGTSLLVDLPLALGPHVVPSASPATQRTGLRLWSRALLAAADARVAVTGLDNLASTHGPFIVASLHESFVDVPALATLPLDLRFTARQELFDDPNLGPLLTASHHVPIPEVRAPHAVRSLITELEQVAAAEESIVVFPQGSLLGVEIAFQPGFWRIPRWLELPVLPVTIAGSHFVWGYPLDDEVRFGRTISVVIHEPIPAQEWSAERSRSMEREMKATAIAIGSARRYIPERDGWWDGYTFAIDDDFPGLAARLTDHRGR